MKNLGADSVWITPCFPSPQVDCWLRRFGLSSLDPMYGTMRISTDVLRIHKRISAVILDFGGNHTSYQLNGFPFWIRRVVANRPRFAIGTLARLAR